MIRERVDYLTNAPWISLFSGAAILITVLAFNLIGDGIRDVVDPKLRTYLNIEKKIWMVFRS